MYEHPWEVVVDNGNEFKLYFAILCEQFTTHTKAVTSKKHNQTAWLNMKRSVKCNVLHNSRVEDNNLSSSDNIKRNILLISYRLFTAPITEHLIYIWYKNIPRANLWHDILHFMWPSIDSKFWLWLKIIIFCNKGILLLICQY